MVDLENSLILLEMLLMSIAASKAFTFHDFKKGGVNRSTFKEVLR